MKEQMMAGLELLKERVARLGADVWEVYAEHSTVRAILAEKRGSGEAKLRAGKVQEWNEMGWAVRLKKAGRLVFTAADTEEKVLRFLESAIVSVASFPEAEWEAPAVFDPHHQPIQPDDRWEKEPVEIRLKVLTELGVVPALSYRERKRERILVNSYGIKAMDESTYFEVWSRTGAVALHRTFGALLEDLLRNYHRVLQAPKRSGWKGQSSNLQGIPWLLPPDEAVTLLGVLLYLGEHGRGLPEKVSPEIDLVEDGVLPGGYGTDAFDGQGGKTSRVIIYENGESPKTRGLVQDIGEEPVVPPVSRNGEKVRAKWVHWRRDSYIHRPRLGFTNLIIPPGELEMEFILSELPAVFSVLELGVTFSGSAGYVSLNALGTIMRNGKPVETTIMSLERVAAGEVWQRISARCREFTMVGRLGAPALLMETKEKEEFK